MKLTREISWNELITLLVEFRSRLAREFPIGSEFKHGLMALLVYQVILR